MSFVRSLSSKGRDFSLYAKILWVTFMLKKKSILKDLQFIS